MFIYEILEVRPVAAGDVRKRVVEYGASIRDKAIETLPHEYSLVVEQIRSISRTYRNDLNTLILNLANIKNLDLFVIYVTLLAVTNRYKALSFDELAKLARSFQMEVDIFSASRLKRALVGAGLSKELTDAVISDLIKSLNTIRNKYKSLHIWIVRQKRISIFENKVRSLVFRGQGGGGVGRGVKLFLRLFIHETNAPLAPRIAYTQEVKKYILHGDIYTAYVTLRSGAFEDINSLTSERVKARVAKRLLCGARGERCRDVVLRLESVRGLVRHVGKISGDPVLYERGAHDIGVKYCRDLRCEICPIRDVCRKYLFIKIK